MPTDPAEKFLPCLQTWIGDFIAGRPDAAYLRDDLEGTAALKLVEVTRQRPDATRAYIRQAVMNALADAMQEAGIVSMPRKTAADRRDNGEPLPGWTRLPDDEALAGFVDADDPQAIAELLEELQACCEDQTDREIVGMMAHSTMSEIAAELGIVKSTVCKRWQRISDKFRKRAGM